MGSMEMMVKSMFGFDPGDMKTKAEEIATAIYGFIKSNEAFQKATLTSLADISARLAILEAKVAENGTHNDNPINLLTSIAHANGATSLE